MLTYGYLGLPLLLYTVNNMIPYNQMEIFPRGIGLVYRWKHGMGIVRGHRQIQALFHLVNVRLGCWPGPAIGV